MALWVFQSTTVFTGQISLTLCLFLRLHTGEVTWLYLLTFWELKNTFHYITQLYTEVWHLGFMYDPLEIHRLHFIRTVKIIQFLFHAQAFSLTTALLNHKSMMMCHPSCHSFIQDLGSGMAWNTLSRHCTKNLPYGVYNGDCSVIQKIPSILVSTLMWQTHLTFILSLPVNHISLSMSYKAFWGSNAYTDNQSSQ